MGRRRGERSADCSLINLEHKAVESETRKKIKIKYINKKSGGKKAREKQNQREREKESEREKEKELKNKCTTKRRTKHEINLNLLYKQNLIKIHFI